MLLSQFFTYFHRKNAKTGLVKYKFFAEFGKIVCISVGLVVRDTTTQELSVRLKSYEDHDEKKLLQDFSNLLSKHFTINV